MTTALAVRCFRSCRCLLIYWRDSFRRRAAFRKWRRCCYVRGGSCSILVGKLIRYRCINRRRTETKGDEVVVKREKETDRLVIFISDRCALVTLERSHASN